ncbi:FAD:protein FMN transferase [Gordonia sp. YY1]|uniref:FAD:protein FMN transferase n=1 Tax=Gordonia sp. YY1 TaxID=396712 RepID=UPI001331B2DC|nr:FAD:protein FMN transferase [Gordonia sp. YY1]KAF0968310.1 FAD:protein FMN transferase [Gordonia sp. YY1]
MNGATMTAELAQSHWQVWGTDAHLIVTDPVVLEEAQTLVQTELAAIDLACSRFRETSEIRSLTRSNGRPMAVSRLLADFIDAALDAARMTGGAVDPTVGSALIDLGYDRDFAALSREPHAGRRVVPRVVQRASWKMVTSRDQMVTVPAGVILDLGATAKALAADRCAALVHTTFGCGVLVNLGGDLSISGPTPVGGWQIRVQDGDDQPAAVVETGQNVGIATSSTLRRRWHHAGESIHHIIDPVLGTPAQACWRTVTVAATSCLIANTVSTACMVRGRDASQWAATLALPVRFVDQAGAVTHTAAWPRESRNQ